MEYIKIDLKESKTDFRRKDELFRYISVTLSAVFLLCGLIFIVINSGFEKKSRETLLIKAKKKSIIAEENRKIEAKIKLLKAEDKELIIDGKIEEQVRYIMSKLSDFSLNDKLLFIEESLSGTESKLEIFNFDGKSFIIVIELDKKTNSKKLIKEFEDRFDKVITKERDSEKIRLELRW